MVLLVENQVHSSSSMYCVLSNHEWFKLMNIKSNYLYSHLKQFNIFLYCHNSMTILNTQIYSFSVLMWVVCSVWMLVGYLLVWHWTLSLVAMVTHHNFSFLACRLDNEENLILSNMVFYGNISECAACCIVCCRMISLYCFMDFHFSVAKWCK